MISQPLVALGSLLAQSWHFQRRQVSNRLGSGLLGGTKRVGRGSLFRTNTKAANSRLACSKLGSEPSKRGMKCLTGLFLSACGHTPHQLDHSSCPDQAALFQAAISACMCTSACLVQQLIHKYPQGKGRAHWVKKRIKTRHLEVGDRLQAIMTGQRYKGREEDQVLVRPTAALHACMPVLRQAQPSPSSCTAAHGVQPRAV